ncbi:DUF1835 domain-containing protein [Kaarinaea lacus]
MITNLAALREQLAAQNYRPHDFKDGDPRKLNHLSLEQQKKRAKELLKYWRANNNGPIYAPKLSDAQQSIAQQHGFRKWTDFKAHIEQARIAREVLQSGQPAALDADLRTLHIRCGTDIKNGLALAGFNGDFLCFVDLYVHGRVTSAETLEEFLIVRAKALGELGVSFDDALARLQGEYGALENARDYDRVMLWFEHDSHDQLILAKLLDYFSKPEHRPGQLHLISVTHFPGVKRFNGIGQLPPEALRVLWQQFAPVTQSQLNLGQQAWQAITAATPVELMALVQSDTPVLPTMAGALRRHLFELPSVENGLSLTEQLTLQILNDKGEMNAARLFGWYTNHYEPLPFLGDAGYWIILSGLADVERPALIINKLGEQAQQWQVSATKLAQQLLNNEVDWLDVNSVQRWVGGISIDSRNSLTWRIDRQNNKISM